MLSSTNLSILFSRVIFLCSSKASKLTKKNFARSCTFRKLTSSVYHNPCIPRYFASRNPRSYRSLHRKRSLIQLIFSDPPGGKKVPIEQIRWNETIAHNIDPSLLFFFSRALILLARTAWDKTNTRHLFQISTRDVFISRAAPPRNIKE